MNCHKRIVTLIILVAILTWGGMAGVSLAVDNRGHGAPADALPKDLKNVSVKDYFLPGKTKESGVIQTAIGHVIVARGNLSQAYFAANGDKLYEQDIVFTLKASKCRVKLLNNDIITLGAHTRITVKEVVGGEKNASEKKTNLSMARGQAMFYAIRTLSQKGAAMTVESPTSVAGVRGTKFGMEVTIEGENSTAALPLLLADASDNWGRHLILAQANPPTPTITTTVHGFDGTVAVTSTVDGRTQSVGAGQTVSASPQGVGAIIATPPQVSQRFQTATDVPPPGGGGGGSQSSSGSSSTTSGNAPDAKTTSDATGTSTTNIPDTSSITQQQNVNTEEEKATKKAVAKDPVTDPRANAPGAGGSSGQSKGYGYFASLLSNTTDGTLAGAFASQYRYDGDSSVWARGPNDADYVRVLGNSGVKGGATLKWVVFDSGNKNSGELNSTISSTTIGQNDYMEWGYAIIGDPFTVDGKKYAFDNRAYWIFGGNIPSMVNVPQRSATYSGAAYGTYWSAGGGKNMTGTFNSNVNFTSLGASITNFGLYVSGNGAYASIDGGSGTIGNDAAFSITGGTWSLNGVTPDKTTAKGSLYGSYGDNMGGVWGMYSTATNTAAGGIFQGVWVRKGHIAGMLESDYQTGTYSNTYMTTSVQDFSSSNASAYTDTNNTYYAQINGTTSPKNMVGLYVNDSVLGTWKWEGSQNVSFTMKGYNDYMEWGTWTQTNAMRPSNIDYYFQNQGAYVWGSPTTGLEMDALKSTGSAVYTGDAWGTHFVANSAGTPLAGSFSGTVNFTTPTITDFNVNVTGAGGNSVVITGATGTFTPGTSSFTISPGIGSWTINGSTTAEQAKSGASGTVYGNGANKGQYIGGVWKAGAGTLHAVGGFQGSKQAGQQPQ